MYLFSLLLCNIAIADQFRAKVIKIIDGDSLVVVTGGEEKEIRLYGMDCPEFDQPYSKKAKRFVEKQILGRTVEVTAIATDRYNRLVAIIDFNNSSINQQLIKKGLAWVYPKYCRKKICKSWRITEKNAVKNEINIWSKGSSVSPWVWKRKKHQQRFSN